MVTLRERAEILRDGLGTLIMRGGVILVTVLIVRLSKPRRSRSSRPAG